MRARSRTVNLEITAIGRTTDRGVEVTLKRTGKNAWVSRRMVEFWPGRIEIPAWLAEKLLRAGENDART